VRCDNGLYALSRATRERDARWAHTHEQTSPDIEERLMEHVQPLLSSEPGAKFAQRHYLQDSLWAIGGVVLVSSVALIKIIYPQNPIALLITHEPFKTMFIVYLFMVLVLASLRGLYGALLASILSLLAFDFIFLPQFYKLHFHTDLSLPFVSVLFLTSTIGMGYLVAAQRKRAEQARSREQELRVLYRQAQELAALQERHRLARELHDSVSQALYGISLGAHTAREALKSEPEQALASLEYVIALAEVGLAEMRALIFELRPESLETEGLGAALGKQVAILRTRHNLTVETDLNEEPELSFEQKEALYRIGVEALHNIVKHAHASMVEVRLRQQADEISLEVHDNGQGFDPRDSFPGHLGLSSMQERAAKIGGTLTVESAPGSGTRICVRVNRQAQRSFPKVAL
jgi:signal transduction histidine kinase